jgi:two-component system sensor histidine kinase ChiS
VIGTLLIFCLIVVVTPVTVFSHTALWFQILMFIMVVYILMRLVRIIRKKREGGIVFLCGFCVLFIAAVHDTLYTHLLIQSRSVAHVSVFLFIIFQSFLLSKKFSGAFYKVEEMTETLKQQNKKLIEADELKNEFLANTSHELRTPLHGIMGLAESMLMLNSENLAPRQKKNLSLIATSGRRLFNLINDLLDYSKIRKQELELNLRPVDLKGICRLVTEFSVPLIAGKRVVIDDEIPENLPPVMADEDRLQQILFNLVGNAVKFTPKGRIVIRAGLTGDNIDISVADTGIGIDPKDQERVFNAFEQADGSPERMFPGTGLGLAISRKLVMLHGSHLRLKSVTGQGSEFSFILKASAESVTPHDEGPVVNNRWFHVPGDDRAIDTPANHHGDRYTILVVDDEPVNLELVCTYLEEDNRYSVITAGSGYDALERIEDEPDLILLDVMMPGMNGFEVCRALRCNPLTQSLPVIILSAKNQINDLVQGLECGANDYLPKPFYKEELLARIQAHLKAAESVKQLEINRLLHEEINRREKVEQELRISRRKLARILDSATDAIIVSDTDGIITFFNHGAESLFGYTANEAIHQSVSMIFEEVSFQDFRNHTKTIQGNPFERHVFSVRGKRHDHEEFNARVYLSLFNIGKEQYQTLIVKPVVTSALEKETDRSIQAMENSVASISDYVGRDSRADQADLRHIPPGLDDTDDALATDKNHDTVRYQIVETMATALACWEITTGKSRIDLSEESGIWKAYLDGGTWKTRTLNKYLSLNTLPSKPRWREVLRTAHFVLSRCNDPSVMGDKLRACAEQLENTLRFSRLDL